MPIYEYRCDTCGSVSEHLVLVQEETPARCRFCGSSRLNRIPSASYLSVSSAGRTGGRTCCGREERCERPPC